MIGRVTLLVVALCCCSVLAQEFEHLDVDAADLSLSAVSATWANPSLHTERLATTVGNVIPGGDCVQNVHDVTNIVQDDGNYFSVIITPEVGRSLSVITESTTTNTWTIIESDGGTFTGSTGSCTGATTCEFFYYCDDYSAITAATVRVFSSKAETTDSSITYDLSFRQFTESIADMGTRTLTQSTAVDNPFLTTNPGPQNFVQYYHDLDASLAEESASGRLYVEVNGFNSVTGTAYVCVSNDGLVSYNGALSAITEGSDDIDNDPAGNINSFVNTPAGCPLTCNSDNLAGDGSVVVVFDACSSATNCGFDPDLFIGVIPPSAGSTYTVTVRFRTVSIPSVVSITSAVFNGDGELTDSTGFCDGTIGDFSCDNYYELVNSGSFVTSDPARGPYVRADIFGVYDGVVSAQLTDGNLAGTESLCGGCQVVDSCSGICSDGSCDEVECYLMAFPCDWNTQLSNEWVVTVSGDSQDNANDFIEYGLEIEVGEFPLDTVLPNIDSFSLGSVLPRSYHHYQVTFTSDDIFDDSLFAVELYSNSEQEDVRLIWRYNNVADDGTCLGFDGMCNTNDSPDGSFCRFEFLCCPIANSYSSYVDLVGQNYNDYYNNNYYGAPDDDDFDFTGIPEDTNLSDNGLKVAELRAGTYYFAVQGGVKQNQVSREAIDYTISWKFTRSVPIYDQVTSLHHVYNGDYSPQFYIDIPADDDIQSIQVRVSDVTNGAVRAFLNCGALAGECPCWEASSTCEAGERDLYYSVSNGEPFMECTLFASSCTCTGQRLYVSVLGIENGFENLQNSYVNPYLSSEDHSIGFALTALITRVDEELISTIEASRAVTTVAGSIDTFTTISSYVQYVSGTEYAYFPYDGSEFRYFLVDFSNVELSGLDTFAVSVSAVSQKDNNFGLAYFDDYYDTDLLDVSVAPYLDTFPSVLFTSCDPSAASFCTASLLDPYNNYDNVYYEKTSGSCEIVLQPCVNDPGCFSDVDMEFRQNQQSFTASQYYISLENTHDLGAANGYYSPEPIHFTLSTQIIDQTPVALTADVPVAATVRGRSYQHFSFEMSSAPADSRLVAEFYQHHDQSRYSIVFFMHFVPDGAEQVLAGPSFHCYENDFACDTCVTTVETPFCSYEVSPCDLSGQSGTYYLSAALFRSSFFDDLAEFTIKVHFVPTVELLEGGNQGLLEASSVLRRQTAFYSVTVPTLTVPADNIIGRIVDIDVEVPLYNSYDAAGIFVTITQEQPSEFCNCINAGHFVAEADDINWSRYSCELTGGETYYISVQGGQDDDDFDQTSFVVHAKLRDVIEIPVALTTGSVDTRVIGEYSNIAYTSPEFGTVVDHNQFIAFSFDVNPVAGSTLNFELFQDPQGAIPTTIEVYITRDEFYSPNGANDGADIGPSPSRANCVPALASCVGTLEAGNECQLSIDPCDLSAGTYFITVSGESLPLGVSSQAVNVHVVLTTPGTISIPTTGVAATTTISFTDDIFGSYGVGYFTTAGLGLAAASELEFAYSGSAVSMSVSYGTETNADLSCGSTCSDLGGSPSCDVIACNTVNSDVWFIGIDAGGAASANTFTITPTVGPAGDLSSAGTITTTSGISSFAALGADEWRYHAYTVQASTSSHYELVSSLSANSIFYVDANDVFRPNLVVNGVSEVAMQSDGSVGTQCTSFSTGFFDEATCCYDTTTQVFAVVGNVGAYTLELDFVEFIEDIQSLSLGQSTGSQVLTDSRIDWYRVEVPAGQHIYFDFEVTDGEGELYLNRGQQAGSDATVFNPTAGGDFGSCWDNSGLVDAILVSSCNAGSDCNGFLAACDSCLNTDFSTTFTFAVIPSGATYTETVTYSLLVVGQIPSATLSLSNNNNLLYPTSSLMVDDRQSNDPDAIYEFFEYQFTTPLTSIVGWVPVEDDSDIDDDLDYPHVHFIIDNVRDSTGAAVTNQFPLDVFISSSPFPGNNAADGCYGGRDITTAAGVFPCLENASGAAFSNATVIECSVSVCDIACGQTLYFSVSRSTSDSSDEQYSFDIEILNDFDLLDDFNLVDVSSGTTNTVTTDFDTSYIFVNLAGFSDWESTTAPQVVEVLFDNIQDTVTTLQIETVPQFSCTEEPIATDCTISSTGTASCELIYDPCTTQDALASIEELVFRVRRTSGGVAAFSFDVTATLVTIDPFDSDINNVDVGTPYQHTKEIFDGEWQFFEFEVNPNNNYYWMTVDIAAVCCADVTDDLEVYYSWVSSGADVTDVTRRKRWPSDSCAVADVDLALNGADSNDILDFCVFNGGVFRISIFAQPGLQLFPEFPVTYSIDINVFETVPVVVPLECFDTRLTTSSWTGYYEMHIEAENRGTEFSITMEMSSTQVADVTLHASNGPTPFTRGFNSQCDWAALGNEPLTASVTDYYCVAEVGQTSCTIDIPACEFRTGIYYLFVEDNGVFSSTTSVSIGSHIDRKYIPVANLSSAAPTVSWDGMVNGFYQYYRVNANDGAADFLLQATATSLACDDSDCDYEMYLIDGEVGFAAGSNGDGDERSPHGSACGNFANCFDSSCTFSEGGSCSLEECALSNDVAYIGIRTTSEGHLCKYNLAVNVAADVDNLEVGKLTCSTIVGDADHWLIVDSSDAALSFAESTMTISIEVGDDSDDLTIYIGNGSVPGSDCDLTNFVCLQGTTCTFSAQCLGGNAYLSIYPDTPTVGCSDNTYAITVTRTVATIQTLSIGTTSTGTSSFAASASTGSFVYQANVIAPYSTGRFSDGNADNDCRNTCPNGTPVLVEAITASPTYYFSGAAGMVLEQVVPVSLSASSETAVTFSSGAFGNTFAHFVVDMPDGVSGYTVHFTDVDHCACDGDLTALDFHFYSSDIAPPFSECNACDSGVAMTTGGCDSSFNDFQVTCHTGTSYISISSCDVYTCDVTFNAYVTFDEAASAIPAGTHTAAFQTFVSDNVVCDGAQSSYDFFVDVTDFLSVTAREPHGGSNYDVDVSITTTACDAVDNCSAITTESGEEASCNASGGCRYSCLSAGRYHISVDTSGADASFGEDLFELQVVNAWEPLSGSVSTTIQGDTRHFYEVTNSGGSIQIDLDVTYGPAIEFDVFTGCGSSPSTSFNEYQVCAAGTCSVYIPTEALAPNTPSYFIVLSSAQLSTGPANNLNSEKDSAYTLSVTQGTANCGAPPTTGFCADTAFEGINAFAGITSTTTWIFDNDANKNSEAACRFDELVDRCPRPTAECRQWLKIFSCLESFPQCDANGFQLGTCTDVCSQVEAACGTWLLDDPHPEWGCMSGRYVADSSDSTCHTTPTPTPTPETFPPVQTEEQDSALTPIVVPDFPTIVIELPSEVEVSSDFATQSDSSVSYTPDGDVVTASASDASAATLSVLVAIVALFLVL